MNNSFSYKLLRLPDLDTMTFGEEDKTVLCLGNFDGLHIAHAHLVRQTIELAGKLSDGQSKRVLSGAFFFSIPCGDYFKDRSSGHLMTLEQKLELLGSLGLDFACVADFESLRDTQAADFMRDFLIGECHATGAVCGYNFKFGRGGRGDASLLCEYFGKDNSYVADEIKLYGESVSSSRIREHLTSGNLELAALLLGRSYSVRAPLLCGSLLIPRDAVSPKCDRYRAELVTDGRRESVICSLEQTPEGVLCRLENCYTENCERAEIFFISRAE